MLLLICCFMYLPLCVRGGGGLSVLVFVLVCITLSPLNFCNYLDEEEIELVALL